jgi:hypothetical protein
VTGRDNSIRGQGNVQREQAIRFVTHKVGVVGNGQEWSGNDPEGMGSDWTNRVPDRVGHLDVTAKGITHLLGEVSV